MRIIYIKKKSIEYSHAPPTPHRHRGTGGHRHAPREGQGRRRPPGASRPPGRAVHSADLIFTHVFTALARRTR